MLATLKVLFITAGVLSLCFLVGKNRGREEWRTAFLFAPPPTAPAAKTTPAADVVSLPYGKPTVLTFHQPLNAPLRGEVLPSWQPDFSLRANDKVQGLRGAAGWISEPWSFWAVALILVGAGYAFCRRSVLRKSGVAQWDIEEYGATLVMASTSGEVKEKTGTQAMPTP